MKVSQTLKTDLHLGGLIHLMNPLPFPSALPQEKRTHRDTYGTV